MKRSCGSAAQSAASRTTAAPPSARQLAPGERRDARQELVGAVVQAHLVAGPQRSHARQLRDPGVETAAGVPGQGRRHQPGAAPHVVAVEAAKVDAGAAAGTRHVGLVIVHLHAAHGGSRAARLDHHRVSGAKLALPHGPRDHRADALEGEHAVDGQAQRS